MGDHRPTFKMCVQEIEALLDAEAGLSEISGYTIRRGHEFPGTPSLQPLSSTSSAASSHYHSARRCPSPRCQQSPDAAMRPPLLDWVQRPQTTFNSSARSMLCHDPS